MQDMEKDTVPMPDVDDENSYILDDDTPSVQVIPLATLSPAEAFDERPEDLPEEVPNGGQEGVLPNPDELFTADGTAEANASDFENATSDTVIDGGSEKTAEAEPNTELSCDREESDSFSVSEEDLTHLVTEPEAEENAEDTVSDAAESETAEVAEPETVSEPAISASSADDSLERIYPDHRNFSTEEAVDAMVSIPEMEEAREPVSFEAEIPEEIASPEPFDPSGFIISDESVGESFAKGENDREYVSVRQAEDIKKGYLKRISLEKWRVVGLCFIAVLLLLSENIGPLFGIRLPVFDTGLGIRGLPVLFNMQLLLLATLLAMPILKEGISAVRRRRVTSEVLLISAIVITLSYDWVLYINDVYTYRFYSALPATYMLLSEIFRYESLKGDLASFDMVSSHSRKTVADLLPIGNVPDAAKAFEGLIRSDDDLLCMTEKAGFVTGFFRRTSEKVPDKGACLRFALSILVSLTAAILTLLSENAVPLDAFGAFTLTFGALVPISSAFAHFFPYNTALRHSIMEDSVIVGEVSAAEMASAGVFTLNDTDLFPTENVKVKGIKLYGVRHLDLVLYYVSALFRYISCPLSEVFGGAGKGMPVIRKITVSEVEKGGIVAKIDADQFLVGDSAFMERHGIRLPLDSEGRKKTDEDLLVTLYAAENGALAARFCFQYIPDETVVKTAERIIAEGTSILIRTFDPCLSDALIKTVCKSIATRTRVIFKSVSELSEEKSRSVDAGIVTNGNRDALIRVFFRTVGISRVLTGSTVFAFASLLIGGGAAAGLGYIGALNGIPSVIGVLYALIWLFPVYFFTKIYLKD